MLGLADSGFEDLGSGNIGALIIRIGFWGPLYYNHNMEPTKINSTGNYLGPYIIGFRLGSFPVSDSLNP